MPAPPSEPAARLRAATADIRHHTRQTATHAGPAGRRELDALHAHLAALHQLLDQLLARTLPETPAEAAHLQAARIRLWQAAAHTHDAFHTAPPTVTGQPPGEDCPQRGTDVSVGALLTICQRHLASGATVRRQTTPADLHSPLHGHASYPQPGEERR
ncbi:DUF6238 family protein [Streptomyces sp. NPDC127098]|uniref:DUF6238 family protein n=1 Tax=Streptomyces sp. NPDC127098 TaxID=3347137 RepID=UPI003659389A